MRSKRERILYNLFLFDTLKFLLFLQMKKKACDRDKRRRQEAADYIKALERKVAQLQQVKALLEDIVWKKGVKDGLMVDSCVCSDSTELSKAGSRNREKQHVNERCSNGACLFPGILRGTAINTLTCTQYVTAPVPRVLSISSFTFNRLQFTPPNPHRLVVSFGSKHLILLSPHQRLQQILRVVEGQGRGMRCLMESCHTIGVAVFVLPFSSRSWSQAKRSFLLNKYQVPQEQQSNECTPSEECFDSAVSGSECASSALPPPGTGRPAKRIKLANQSATSSDDFTCSEPQLCGIVRDLQGGGVGNPQAVDCTTCPTVAPAMHLLCDACEVLQMMHNKSDTRADSAAAGPQKKAPSSSCSGNGDPLSCEEALLEVRGGCDWGSSCGAKRPWSTREGVADEKPPASEKGCDDPEVCEVTRALGLAPSSCSLARPAHCGAVDSGSAAMPTEAPGPSRAPQGSHLSAEETTRARNLDSCAENCYGDNRDQCNQVVGNNSNLGHHKGRNNISEKRIFFSKLSEDLLDVLNPSRAQLAEIAKLRHQHAIEQKTQTVYIYFSP